jgi:hypothetical protein
MPGSPLALPLRVPPLAVSALLLVSAALAFALAAPLPAPGQIPALAGAKYALMARAELLYDSAEKSGLHAFRCQVHPDWNLIMTSSRKGGAIACR